jgi:acetyl-CoA carboxylase biotin carboxyl carrier protein
MRNYAQTVTICGRLRQKLFRCVRWSYSFHLRKQVTGENLDIHEIQQLADLVKDADLHELEIERGDMRLKIVNQAVATTVYAAHETNASAQQRVGSSAHTIVRDDRMSHAVDFESDADYHLIKSPIVGTFYSSPSPESPDFVSKNTPVEATSTVCIIEAMKVMNEIQAEVHGIIEDIRVQWAAR